MSPKIQTKVTKKLTAYKVTLETVTGKWEKKCREHVEGLLASEYWKPEICRDTQHPKYKSQE